MLKDYSDVKVDLPSYYNFLEEYPECDFGPLSQNCGCCYIFSAVKTLSHRFCRALRRQILLSTQYLIACDLSNLGCNGGNEKAVFYYLENHGTPELDCQPWQEIRSYEPKVCTKCVDDKPFKLYHAKMRSTRVIHGIENIKKAIYLEGPLSASVISDYGFTWYREGLYRTQVSSDEYNDASNHTVEIHGWGTFDNGTEYWIVQNAFGPRWGCSGLMKMQMGVNAGYIESYMLSVEPELSDAN
ncbi:Clan CA, family C1, cathepsin B-like cysteine peptidase [Trichomonas vaginalis G3]|uniref:Clan CA, family C1, cathepsin B-like cysteine peptidase n=1 Tax=Trichomonas vaginalis (strain ATCC PRA-98 / G3) TaxID=412133 RepID=A2E0B9_TRIV3|nr:cysteine-type peptidase protein [Trichomonas vaginalis G3]EAY13919.1 Clan CA, family C1, cathepsin B-like cysteine peptidase [Trichomonas vaginalis G3]KAI5520897.1 cysteine-type peptidase protein [Trichomonas vaginalis G3]|eukprot:XP_001326142.1 Clan CA, family C1, cathepsin B-like cysteine peptidase [Trichomonas vaginalis G3]